MPGPPGGVVVGPAGGEAGVDERLAVVAGSGTWVADVDDPAAEGGHDLHVLPGQVLLVGEQTGGVVAFADRGDEPVHQHSPNLGLGAGSRGELVEDRVDQRFELLLVAPHGGGGAAEHLGAGVLCQVVPQLEQDHHQRRIQGQRLRPAQRRLPVQDEVQLGVEPVDLLPAEPGHTLTTRRLSVDQRGPHNPVDLLGDGRRVHSRHPRSGSHNPSDHPQSHR
jgi:hypothetical protein